jgi:hypothetical protein
MGRLFLEYMDSDKDDVILCRFCNVHLLNKNNINQVVGLQISMSSKVPVNVHITPTKESFLAYNPNNYKFNDIICNRCNNDIGWTIDYPTTNGEKSFVFLLNESIK